MLALTKRQISERGHSETPIRERTIQFKDTQNPGFGRPRKRSVNEVDGEAQVVLPDPKRRAGAAVENLSARIQELLFIEAMPVDGLENMAWQGAK
jgi:hypothetical protein